MRRGYKAAGVPHPAACRDWIERVMGDVGDPPRSKLRRKCVCIPCVPSESDGNNPHSSS